MAEDDSERSGNTFEFIAYANEALDPFSDSDNIKYIRLSGFLVSKIAEEQGKDIGEDIKEDGVILFGPAAQRHYEIVSENLGIDPLRAKNDIGYVDAGFLGEMGKGEVVVYGASGELKDENGEPFIYGLTSDSERLENLHKETANMLRVIYSKGDFKRNFTHLAKN